MRKSRNNMFVVDGHKSVVKYTIPDLLIMAVCRHRFRECVCGVWGGL